MAVLKYLLIIFTLFAFSIDARLVKKLSSSYKSDPHVCSAAQFAAHGLDISKFIFCHQLFSYQVRANDLVDRMTSEEKVQQLGDRDQCLDLAFPLVNGGLRHCMVSLTQAQEHSSTRPFPEQRVFQMSFF